MGFRGSRRAGRARGWMSLMVLALGLIALCVLGRAPGAGGFPGPAAAQTRSATARAPRPPTSIQRSTQAQAAQNETGDGHAGADLAPALPSCAPACAEPGRAGGYEGPCPAFPSGCAVNGSRPRPPPGRLA